MEPPETQTGLIAKLKAGGNQQAWSSFVADYEPFLRQLIKRQGVPARHIDDVTQQVFAAIAKSVENWEDDGRPASFRRWTHCVARNIVIKFMQKERKQLADATGGSQLVDQLQQVEGPIDRRLEQRYEHELVVWAAEQVRDEFRSTSWQAFWMTLIEGRSVEDVAQQLDLTPGAIYMSRGRIMKRIKQKIDQVLIDETPS